MQQPGFSQTFEPAVGILVRGLYDFRAYPALSIKNDHLQATSVVSPNPHILSTNRGSCLAGAQHVGLVILDMEQGTSSFYSRSFWSLTCGCATWKLSGVHQNFEFSGKTPKT